VKNRKIEVKHEVFVKNATDQDILYAENARRNLNALPEGMGRQAGYILSFTF